jgi:hypothetical protein
MPAVPIHLEEKRTPNTNAAPRLITSPQGPQSPTADVPMSINVEEIGGSLLVQHYVAEVHQPHHCCMVSLTDVLIPLGWTKIQVIWDLSVKAIDPAVCEYTNLVLSYPARRVPRRPRDHGRDVRAGGRRPTGRPPPTPNRRESVLDASSVERAALARS